MLNPNNENSESISWNQEPSLDNPFWQFSLAVYQDPQVQELCLELQNQHAIDVNLLLFSVWLALDGRLYDMDILEKNTVLADWRKQIVVPIRQARLTLANLNKAANLDKADNLYSDLKRIELAAEQKVQAILWQMSTNFPANTDQQDLIKSNLEQLWQHCNSNKCPNVCPIEKTPAPFIHFYEWMITHSAGKIS